MWATMALAAALAAAPHQAGDLKLTNVRATYGFLGAERKDNKFIPGDICFITFTMENLDVGEDGKVLYSMKMELLNPQGKLVFGKEPAKLDAFTSLGGNRMPAFAKTEIGTDTAPGEYTIKLTVTDLRAKKTATLERKFEVLPKEFGLVRVGYATLSEQPVSVPYVTVPGETIFLGGSLLHFGRDPKTMQPNIGLQIRVLDEDGKSVLTKPVTDEVKELNPVKRPDIPIGMPLGLNRPGKFTVELEATDRISKKTAKVSLPLHVIEEK
ncbi:MAG TPA: hypothetical protein VJ739_01765 [Gemmataceae bacterium]|nr:hypothetical protein [Gemmataceae bacterium]